MLIAGGNVWALAVDDLHVYFGEHGDRLGSIKRIAK